MSDNFVPTSDLYKVKFYVLDEEENDIDSMVEIKNNWKAAPKNSILAKLTKVLMSGNKESLKWDFVECSITLFLHS